jgi:uncharacterized damage-inducible protein DinB
MGVDRPARDARQVLLRFAQMQRDRILEVVGELTEEQFQHRFGPSVHSIAWQVWHCARWDDWLAYKLPLMNERLKQRVGTPDQLWMVEGLGSKWGFPEAGLGVHGTGTKMPPEEADALIMPPKDDLVRYARAAFAQLESVQEQLPQADLYEIMPNDPDGDTYADQIMFWVEHDARHLGMIEAMKGLLGLEGSATR